MIKKYSRNKSVYPTVGPYSLWALLFIIVPMAFIAYYAFTDNNFQFTLGNISRFFTSVGNIQNSDGTIT